MVIAAPVGAVTTELASNAHIKLFDTGSAFLFNMAGDTVALSDEALDRLLSTLLARKAARDE